MYFRVSVATNGVFVRNCLALVGCSTLLPYYNDPLLAYNAALQANFYL
jgi:hypothetical protein